MKKRRLLAAVVAAALALGTGAAIIAYRRSAGVPTTAAQTVYYCPMHPSYTSNKPGDCPICGMKLVPREEEAPAGKAEASGKNICLLHKCPMADCVMELPLKPGETVTCPVCGTHTAPVSTRGAAPLYYRHPMRPDVTSPTPKKDEMGMDYVPVYAEEGENGSTAQGRASVLLSEEKRQLIGMKSEPAARRALSTTIRATGRVAYDPELYNAMAEYREAVRARGRVRESPLPDVRERAEALVRSGRLRLRQLGLSQEQIQEAGEEGALPTNLLVGEKGGTVWVYAQVFEHEIGLVETGQPAEIRSPAFPETVFRGRVKAIDPILSAETRSLRVRIEVPNPEGRLKLEMYVNAFIKADLGRRLAIPETAVFDTGERKVAFVDLGEGRIEPRELELGREADGYVEVVRGVSAGERVVTSANFLIDSESRLKAAFPKAKGR